MWPAFASQWFISVQEIWQNLLVSVRTVCLCSDGGEEEAKRQRFAPGSSPSFISSASRLNSIPLLLPLLLLFSLLLNHLNVIWGWGGRRKVQRVCLLLLLLLMKAQVTVLLLFLNDLLPRCVVFSQVLHNAAEQTLTAFPRLCKQKLKQLKANKGIKQDGGGSGLL